MPRANYDDKALSSSRSLANVGKNIITSPRLTSQDLKLVKNASGKKLPHNTPRLVGSKQLELMEKLAYPSPRLPTSSLEPVLKKQMREDKSLMSGRRQQRPIVTRNNSSIIVEQ